MTVEFHSAGRATEIMLTHERLPGAQAVAAHNGGWTDALRLLADRFEARLAS